MNTSLKKVTSLAALYLCLAISGVWADAQLTPRIQIGLNLIPAVLAANKKLNSESSPQSLTLYIVYLENRTRAFKSKKQLESLNNIRDHELTLEVIHLNDLVVRNIKRFDAIFINEDIPLDLNKLIHYAHTQQVILFSPFKGDVKKGVMSGFEVSNKVLPAINLTAMRNSNIDLKAFFLRIAVKYDQ